MHRRTTGRGGLGRMRAAMGAGALALAAAACGSSTSPSAPTLSASSTTVQTALNTFTTGTVSIPAYCGSFGINCPGGTAGAATPITVTRSNLSILPAGQDTFSYNADLALVTGSPFTVSYNGLDCQVAVNTAAGSFPTVHIAGTAAFSSTTTGGALNRVDLTSIVTGAEMADLTITGPAGCSAFQTVGAFAGLALQSALASQTAHFCAAAGGGLTTCS